jgi:hypothetical protein
MILNRVVTTMKKINAKKIRPQRNVLFTHEEYETMTAWFLSLKESELPKTPFELKKGHTVNSPLFYERLREEIARGTLSARAQTGALQDDLVDLMIYIFDRK